METESTFVCSNCHHTHPISDLREFEGSQICAVCFEEQTVVCQQCGKIAIINDQRPRNKPFHAIY